MFAVKPHRPVFVGLAAALAIALWYLSLPIPRHETTVMRVSPPVPARVPGAAPAGFNLAAERIKPTRWSRAEAVKYLSHYFSKEQLGLELKLEQVRYGGQYWEAEPGFAELQSIEVRRMEMIGRLTAELNAMLKEMCPTETGEPLALVPFFSLDRPAPNLAFLGDASRERMEAALLVRGETAWTDPLFTASQILSGQELVDYTRWNAPSAAALRNRLAGFAVNEEEFSAILQWQETAGSDREAEARTELAGRIGSARLAQLDQLNDPGMHTALQDLHRLGLPLDQADWVADFRRQAVVQLQQAWGKPELTAMQKQQEVAVLLSAFGAELATQMKLPPRTADLLP